jgi:hypothetical protein
VLMQTRINGAGAQRADQRMPGARVLTVMTILTVCFAFAACYFRDFVLLKVPIFVDGDALPFVAHGARMVAGELPYRDFFERVPPGTPLVYALEIKAFGLFNWIPNLTMACLAALTVLLMTLTSRRLMPGYTAFLPALLFTGFILLDSGDPTHHWMSTVLVLAAMLAFFGKPTLLRITAAGILCGAAAFFSQPKGFMAVLGFVAYLIWKSQRDNSSTREYWRRCLLLCATAAAAFFAANSYFIATAGVSRWFYCLVTFMLRYYSTHPYNNWSVLANDASAHNIVTAWIEFPFIYCTVPGAYIVFLLVMRNRWKRHDAEIADQLMLVALTGIAMFLAIASSPSLKRLCSVSPPAMILLAWMLDRPGRTATVFRTALGTLAATVAIAAAVRTQTREVMFLNLPAGRTAFTHQSAYEEFRWLRSQTRPGQFFWGWPSYYPAFHLRNPAATDYVGPYEFTRPEEVSGLVQSLRDHEVPMMLLHSDETSTVDSASNHLAPFVAYLHANYRLTRTFATGDEVWEKTASPEGQPPGEE